ncbi:adenylyl-sulfate kinase [Spirosoma litoris]
MLLIQLTGLSGAGKTTLAYQAKAKLVDMGYRVEVLDGDEYRRKLWPELTFSAQDRQESVRRLGHIAALLSRNKLIVLMAAINPYESVRNELKLVSPVTKVVYVQCNVDVLCLRDTKGLYSRALLPDGHPDKITNLTGINDPYEIPATPDLILNTDSESVEMSTKKLLKFVIESL